MIRLFLTTIIVLFVFISFGQINIDKDGSHVNVPDIKVTLFGTGTPPPLMERFGPSILVQAGSETLLFDVVACKDCVK